MSETIDVPGVGPTKSGYVYAGVAASLAVIVYAWWKRRNAAPAVDPNAILADPMLTQNSGGTTTPGISTTVSSEVPDPGSLPPTTNSDWAQRATTILVNTLGYDPQTVAQAIGDYLARQPLSTTEANLIRVAWGQLGRPPVGDFPINTTPSSGGTSPPPAPNPVYSVVLPGYHVDPWIEDVNKGFSSTAPGVHALTFDSLVAMNSDLNVRGNIEWRAPTAQYPGTRNNVFRSAARYRVA